MSTKHFHVGDVLSVTTDKLLSPNGMGGVYDILEYLTNAAVFRHQVPRILQEAGPHLRAQFPALSHETGEGVNENNHHAWLARMAATHGEWLEVSPLAEQAVETIDPVSELAEKKHPDQIAVIHAGAK